MTSAPPTPPAAADGTAADDPHLAAVLAALHSDPGRLWTVGCLARHAAMSRSAFAVRFRAAVGCTPLAYVTRLRMERAKVLLRCCDARLGEVAGMLGYASEEGFRRAFQRHVGRSPHAWRHAPEA